MIKNVTLTPSTQRKLEIFSTVTNMSTDEVFEEALADWLDTVATARLEALAVGSWPSNVISIDTIH